VANIQKIEQEISNLKPHELAEFRAWFDKFDAERWDSQFESDVKALKLDELAADAVKDFKNKKF